MLSFRTFPPGPPNMVHFQSKAMQSYQKGFMKLISADSHEGGDSMEGHDLTN